MYSRSFLLKVLPLLALFFASLGSVAQDASTQGQKPAARPVSPYARLNQARTAFLKNGGGSDVPYNMLESAMLETGRFIIVGQPEKADVIVEITSPDQGNSTPKSDSSKSKTSLTGMGEALTGKKKEESKEEEDKPYVTPIVKLVVYDAKTKIPLWSASEQPKGGVRQKTREDNINDSAQNLITKLRQRIQPAIVSNQ